MRGQPSWWYLSGPMAGRPDHGYPEFTVAAEKLRELGYSIVSPHEAHPPPNGPIDHTEYLRRLRADLREMLECRGIIMLPGWQQSLGARLELTTAVALELDVAFFDGQRVARA